MPVETTTNVEEMTRVQDGEGESAAPATEKAARGTFQYGGSEVAETAADYPIEFSPENSTIYELLVFESGADTTVEITTSGGSVITVPLNGRTAVLDGWEISSVTISNPNDQRTIAAWSGE